MSWLFSNPGNLPLVQIEYEDWDPNAEIDLIGLQVISSISSWSGYTKLFPGQNQHDWFIKWFHKIAIENEEEF